MRAAQAPVIVTMVDLSDDYRIVEEMVARAEAGTAVVCPSRYMPGGRQIGGPWLKNLLSRTAGLTLHWLAGVPTRDAINSFKAYRRDFLERTPIESTAGFSLGLELVAKAHFSGERVEEIPAIWQDRTAGESRFRLAAWLPLYCAGTSGRCASGGWDDPPMEDVLPARRVVVVEYGLLR